MKKYLITAVLILAVISTLTAGTLARYTQDLGEFEGFAQAQTFHITATKGCTFMPGVVTKMAPGDTVYFKMELTNDEEATADITALATLSDDFDDRLVMSIVNGSWDKLADSEYTFEKVAYNEKKTFFVKLDWPYGADVNDNGYRGRAVKVTLDMNAVSSDLNRNLGDPKTT